MVTRAALQNAASIAALLLTTECIVADKPEAAPAMPPGGDMGGMGGMGGMGRHDVAAPRRQSPAPVSPPN